FSRRSLRCWALYEDVFPKHVRDSLLSQYSVSQDKDLSREYTGALLLYDCKPRTRIRLSATMAILVGADNVHRELLVRRATVRVILSPIDNDPLSPPRGRLLASAIDSATPTCARSTVEKLDYSSAVSSGSPRSPGRGPLVQT